MDANAVDGKPGCNQPKSLSGIETYAAPWFQGVDFTVAINLNPYQGLKRRIGEKLPRRSAVAINLNPYQGLKLKQIPQFELDKLVAINLNPYQGLKQDCFPWFAQRRSQVAINLNPYQGLKRI